MNIPVLETQIEAARQMHHELEDLDPAGRPCEEQDTPIAFSIPSITDDDVDAVVRVLRSGWITSGPECVQFESELADFLGVPHVVVCSAATTAQEIVLAWTDLPPGARVGVPDWTFASTALAVHRTGAVPVLLDIDPADLNLSARSLEAALEEGLDAVVAVHFGGVGFSPEIHRLCAEADVPLIEDAAHAFGTHDHRGLIAGQGTTAACFSFYATKNLSTGEGGALATTNQDLADFARTYRLHGMSLDAINRYSAPGIHRYDIIRPGIKANMPDLLAAIGRSQLSRFAVSQARRREITNQYRSLLDCADLRFVPTEASSGSADHLLVVDLLDSGRCARVLKQLTNASIGTSVHFRPLHTFSWFESAAIPIGPTGLGVSASLDGRVMSLPLHVGLTGDDVNRVAHTVLEAL